MRRACFWLLLGFAASFCLSVFAQEPGPGEQGRQAPPPGPAQPPPPPPKPPVPPNPAQPAKPDEPKEPDNSPPDEKKIDEAIKKGVEWLAKLQDKDGSFKVYYQSSYPMGCTALALLALLKSGVNPRSPGIGTGFKYLEGLPIQRTYSVAIYVLAIEALYAPSEKQMEKTGKPYTTVLRENIRRKSSGHDMVQVNKLVEWLIENQQENVWRYPSGGEDLSNTQYALLALYSGMRMGCGVSPKVFRKAADYLILNQEEEGEEVESFPVPAADFSLKDLRKLEKELRQKAREVHKEEVKKNGKIPDSGPTTTVVEDPYSRFGVERRAHKMFARGWSYTVPPPPKPGQQPYKMTCTGSMTTAGLASAVIAKTGLEGSRYFPKKYRFLLDKSIRDGAAWIAKYFTVTGNPYGGNSSGNTHYLYYYLYGLERAGILTLCTRFADHDWYNKGAKYIIKEQEPEGYWEGYKIPSPQPQPGQPPPPARPPNHVDTCFALLFLKRATVPVISIPPEMYTGGDLFADKNKKKEEAAKEGEEKEPGEKPAAPEEQKEGSPKPAGQEKPAQPAPAEPQKPAGK